MALTGYSGPSTPPNSGQVPSGHRGATSGPVSTPNGTVINPTTGAPVPNGSNPNPAPRPAPPPRPRYAGVGERARNAAWDTINASMNAQLAGQNVERNRLGALANLDRQGYEIQKIGLNTNYNAAQRQPGYINSLYNNSLSQNDQQRLQQAIANQANQRQYGMIAANRKDLNADWTDFQAANAQQQAANTRNERLNRVAAAEQVAGRGMMGAGARAGIIGGRANMMDTAAQLGRDLSAGQRQYGAKNRNLDEMWASTKDNENVGISRLASLGLDRDRLGIQNREDLAGANDNITKADVARKYAANQQAVHGINNIYDLWQVGTNENQIRANAGRDVMSVLPYYIQQEHDKVTAAQNSWDRKYGGR